MHFSRTQWLCASLSLLVFAGLALGEAGLWPLEAFDRAITDAVPALRTETLNLLMLAVTALGNTRFLVFVAFTTVLALLAAKSISMAALNPSAFRVGMPPIQRSSMAHWPCSRWPYSASFPAVYSPWPLVCSPS